MQTIYQFEENRIFTGLTNEIADDEGAPKGWTFEAPPEIPEGCFASFRGPDWVILDEYPLPGSTPSEAPTVI